jgi:beta propeller repeat protein
MKRKLLISLIISFITVLGLNISAQADTTITQVTSNSCEDSFPQIKGNYVVWQGYVDNDWEIFLYDIDTGLDSQITYNDYNDISPRTDGEYVVWFGACNQGGEVFVYDINSGITTRITNDTNVDSPPQIADGRVVWASHQVTDSVEPGEIYLYDIGTKVTQRLTTNSLDDGSPRINSEAVIWIQIDESGDDTLYIHYIGATGSDPAPEDLIWEDSPQTDGDLTVSMRNDGHNWEIIIRKDGQNGFEQVTNTSMDNRYPSISGDYMTWMAGEGSASEIYIAKYDAPAAECKGDLDGNGAVDKQDWLMFIMDWRRTDCRAAGVEPCNCDLDHNGICDREDRQLFKEDWGRTDCPVAHQQSREERARTRPIKHN